MNKKKKIIGSLAVLAIAAMTAFNENPCIKNKFRITHGIAQNNPCVIQT